jgi:hypothetical protein
MTRRALFGLLTAPFIRKLTGNLPEDSRKGWIGGNAGPEWIGPPYGPYPEIDTLAVLTEQFDKAYAEMCRIMLEDMRLHGQNILPPV